MKKNYSTGKNNYSTGQIICCPPKTRAIFTTFGKIKKIFFFE
jgi:hypothetical protein